jgi:hypothetical protein
MRLERTVPAEVVHRLVRLPPSGVERWVGEQVSRSDELSIVDLEAQSDDPWWPIES